MYYSELKIKGGYMKKCKIAFTLAEVLITLGVIGVVAAITLPIIHSNIQEHILRNQFKKSYSNLFNAMNRVEAENGAPYACGIDGRYTTSECTLFWTNVLKQLNVLNKSCKYGETNCAPTYKLKTEVVASGGNVSNSSCSFLYNSVNDKMLVYYFVDNSIIILFTEQRGVHFALDINGTKGPNKWGYDLFYMTLDRRNNKLNLTDSVCAMWEKGGKRVNDMLYNK